MLTQALHRLGPRDPGALMGEVSRGVKAMLGQSEDARGQAESDDGLDAAFLWFDARERLLRFAGARMTLHLLAPGQGGLQLCEGERAGLGYVATAHSQAWPSHDVRLAPGTLLFAATDGLTDQIGGPKAIAYGKRRLRACLQQHAAEPAVLLASQLLDELADWQGAQPRRDDLTFFCCRP